MSAPEDDAPLSANADLEAACPDRVTRAPLLYHVRASDGKLAPLILQSFQDEASLPPTQLWRRMGAKPTSPTTTLGKVSYWIAAPVLQPGSAQLNLSDGRALGKAAVRLMISWPMGCLLFYGFEFLRRPFQAAIQTPGLQLALPDSRYEPVRHRGAHETGVRSARAESSTAPAAPQRRAYTDDIDLDAELVTEQPEGADDAHTILLETSDQGTASRPRYLCYIRDPATNDYETINVSQFLDKEGDDVDMEFVFVSYTRVQFRVATDDEIDAFPDYPDEATREANRQLARHDRSVLVQWGVDAAKRAGKRAFWIDFECVRDKDGVARTSSKSDDVYRICDVVRAAHSMIIATGPPASEKVDAILAGEEHTAAAGQQATTKWLRHWGSRLWTLPELLLCPSEHRVQLYVFGQETSEPVALAKRNFAERAWEDAELVKELVNHYEGSAILSQLQLVETALACFARRGTQAFSPGDIAYALMGLLPASQRPAVHPGDDTGFQAFARLSLSNDGGEFLSRMVCLLPEKNDGDDAAWYDQVNDVWGARIRDVHPTSRVVKLAAADAAPDTLVLDGAPGASIRWDAFDADGVRQGEMPASTVLLSLLVWSVGVTVGAVGVLRLANTVALGRSRRDGNGDEDGDVWATGRALLGALVAVAILGTPAFWAPLLYVWYQRGNVRQAHMKAQLVGIEGYVDVAAVERHLWGHDGGRLTLVDATASEHGYRDDDDPVEDDDQQQQQCGKSHFTIVDTHMMTVRHIATRKPPVAVFAVGSAAGAQRVLLCSYDWRDDTFARETVLRAESKMVEQMRRIDQFRLRLRSSSSLDDGGDDAEPAMAAQDTTTQWRQQFLYCFLIFMAMDMSVQTFAGQLGQPIDRNDEHCRIAYGVAFAVAQIPAFFIAAHASLERAVPQLILIKAFLPGLLAIITSTAAGRVARSTITGLVEGTLYPLLLALVWLWWLRPSAGRLTARLLVFHAAAFVLPTLARELLGLVLGRLDLQALVMYFFTMMGMIVQVSMASFGRAMIGRPKEVGWLPGSVKLALLQPSRPRALTSSKERIVPLVQGVVALLAHLATNAPAGALTPATNLWLLYVYGAIVVLFTICISRFQKSTALLMILVVSVASAGSIWANNMANSQRTALPAIMQDVRLMIVPLIIVLANGMLETWTLKVQVLCLSLAGLLLDGTLKLIWPFMYSWQLQLSAGVVAVTLLAGLWVYETRRTRRIAL